MKRVCAVCKGEGELRSNPGWPDPQCEETTRCPRCHGTGVLEVRVETKAA